MYIHFGQESSRDKAGQKAHGRQQAHSLGLNISTGIVGCVLKTVQKQCEKGLNDLGRPMYEVHVFSRCRRSTQGRRGKKVTQSSQSTGLAPAPRFQ